MNSHNNDGSGQQQQGFGGDATTGGHSLNNSNNNDLSTISVGHPAAFTGSSSGSPMYGQPTVTFSSSSTMPGAHYQQVQARQPPLQQQPVQNAPMGFYQHLGAPGLPQVLVASNSNNTSMMSATYAQPPRQGSLSFNSLSSRQSLPTVPQPLPSSAVLPLDEAIEPPTYDSVPPDSEQPVPGSIFSIAPFHGSEESVMGACNYGRKEPDFEQWREKERQIISTSKNRSSDEEIHLPAPPLMLPRSPTEVQKVESVPSGRPPVEHWPPPAKKPPRRAQQPETPPGIDGATTTSALPPAPASQDERVQIWNPAQLDASPSPTAFDNSGRSEQPW